MRGTMKLRRWTFALAMVVGLSAPLSGHHSFAAYYFEDQMIEVEGEISEVQFKAPHTWVHVVSQDASGKAKTYAAEWSNPTRLERDGVTKDTLKIGDSVRIWGSPGRDAADNRVHLKRILRPRDGWEWKPARRQTR